MFHVHFIDIIVLQECKMKKMNNRCWVVGCPKKYGDVSSIQGRKFLRFHKFPQEEGLKKRWIECMGRKHVSPSTMRICSDHFPDKSYTLSTLLKSRMCYTPGMQIVLQEDAVPNTELFQRENCEDSGWSPIGITGILSQIITCFQNKPE